MTPKPSSGSQLSSVEIATLAGTIALPAVAYFLLPAVPESKRVIVGLALGFLALVGFAIYIVRSLRREIRRSTTELKASTQSLAEVITERSTDHGLGILRMGNIRNVSLRAATVHRLIENVLVYVPEERRLEAMTEAGRKVGLNWGEDFLRELELHSALGTLKERLIQWSDYDAEAGLGRIEFSLSNDGIGSIIVRHGFLSTQDAVFPLDYFFVGYFEGTLRYLLSKPVVVELLRASTTRHEESIFSVSTAE